MIRVRIVNGSAIDAEVLKDQENAPPFLRKLVSLWDQIFMDRFEIIGKHSYDFMVIEGHEYWGWPCGNGRIYLVEHINNNNMIA